MNQPFWLEDPAEPIRSRVHAGPVDAIVIGGGVTGCACALALARGGLRVRLHEARRVAGGASGRNGGFALRGGAMPYDLARASLGEERARALWTLTERALERLEELAGNAFHRTGSLRLAADETEREELRREYEALRADRFTVEWEDELAPSLRGLFGGALRHPTDGSIQPARWVRRLGQLAADAGAEIREHSRVESLEGLKADHVVIATDGYSRGLLDPLDQVVLPTRGQVLVTAPLRGRLFTCPHYARRGYDYWQQTDDRRLVLGGQRDADLATEETREEATTPLIQGRLEALAGQLAEEPVRVTHRWAGIFGRTADLVPLAGGVPGSDGLWVACGYSGHGNVLGLACGELVADAVLGKEPPELGIFSPSRFF